MKTVNFLKKGYPLFTSNVPLKLISYQVPLFENLAGGSTFSYPQKVGGGGGCTLYVELRWDMVFFNSPSDSKFEFLNVGLRITSILDFSIFSNL